MFTASAAAAASANPQAGAAITREAGARHAGGVSATIVPRCHLDVLVITAAIGLLVFDAQIGEVDLVIEVRQVALGRPAADFLVGPIRVSVVVAPLAIPFVKPRLVITLELVVEDDALHARAALGQTLCLAFVRAIDLKVMFPFSLAFEAIPERLTGTLVPITVVFQHAAAFARQRHGVVARAGHTNRLDQPLLAEVAQVAGARIGRPIVVIPEITTGDHS